MTDLEVMRQLTRLMGWEVVGPEVPRKARYDFSGPHVYVGPDGSLWRGIKPNGDAQLPWCPLDSMDAAWMIVERMQKEGYDYEIASCLYDEENGTQIDGHSAMFMRGAYDLIDGAWDEMHAAVAPTPTRAVCLASLKAPGAESE